MTAGINDKAAPGKPFQKGKSGNPSGRPKTVGPVRDLAREHTFEAVKTLVEVMKDKAAPPSARVTAADKILERGWGKAPQPLDGDGEGGPVKMLVSWLPIES